MTIRRRIVGRAVLAATLAGLVVVPAVIAVVQFAAGSLHAQEIAIGSAVGTLFFTVTGVAAAIFQDGPNLKAAVLGSYVTKTSILLAVGMSVSLEGLNRPTLATATAASAIAYVAVQTLLITRRNARLRREFPVARPVPPT